MNSIRSAMRVALCLAALCAGAVAPPPAPSAEINHPIDAVAAPEVRIRKLHLVRPDLIPYPLYYEVIC